MFVKIPNLHQIGYVYSLYYTTLTNLCLFKYLWSPLNQGQAYRFLLIRLYPSSKARYYYIRLSQLLPFKIALYHRVTGINFRLPLLVDRVTGINFSALLTDSLLVDVALAPTPKHL